jgi:hypothetical protein
MYTGTVQPVAGTCEAVSAGTLTLRANAVEFAPTSGVLVLTGTLAKDGSIRAQLVRPGSDKHPYTLTLQATLKSDQIEGDYLTPRCHYRLHLSAN